MTEVKKAVKQVIDIARQFDFSVARMADLRAFKVFDLFSIGTLSGYRFTVSTIFGEIVWLVY